MRAGVGDVLNNLDLSTPTRKCAPGGGGGGLYQVEFLRPSLCKNCAHNLFGVFKDLHGYS